VFDVGEFVRHHATQFALGQHVDDAGGGRDGCVLRAAAGGKGVGRLLVDQIDLGHRDLGALGQLAHHGVEARRGGFIHLAGVVHLQHHLVREPVAEEVHAQGHDQGQHHAAAAADHAADGHEEGGDRRHQDGGFHHVEHGDGSPVSIGFSRARGFQPHTLIRCGSNHEVQARWGGSAVLCKNSRARIRLPPGFCSMCKASAPSPQATTNWSPCACST